MSKVSYVLKSQRGTPVFSFDDITRARQEIKSRKARNVTLRLFEVTMMEREIEV